MGNTGRMRNTGIRVRCRVLRWNKRVRVRTRDRNVTENSTGVLHMKMENGEMRLGPGCGEIDQSSGMRLHEVSQYLPSRLSPATSCLVEFGVSYWIK